MQTLFDTLGTILGIDPALRAPVKYFEIFMPVSLVAEVLGRSPDPASPDVLSWGRLNRKEIAELIELSSDPFDPKEALESVHSLFDNSNSEELLWCLRYQQDRQRGQ